MEMNQELVRHVLIKVAAEGHDPHGYLVPFESEGFSDEAVSYHVWLLQDGGFLTAINLSTPDGTHYAPRVLTHAGQELLATIRSKEVWEQTKSLATKGGIHSLKAVWEIAKRIAERKLDEFLKGEGL
jgi:hypothetical protein